MKHSFYIVILIIASQLIAFSADNNFEVNSEINSLNDYYLQYYQFVKPQKGNGYKPYKRWSDFWNERLINYKDTIEKSDKRISNVELNEVNLTKISRKIYQDLNKISPNLIKKWEELGPFIIPLNKLEIPSSGIGRTSCIAINPKNENNIFLGTACGGMWESKNSGISWNPINFTQFLSIGISDIVFSFSDTNIIYAITGDVNGIGLTNNYSLGIIKSNDAGKTWNFTNDSILLENNILFSKVYVSKFNSNDLILASNKGIYLSNDGLKTFRETSLSDYYVRDMIVNPDNENEIIISTIKNNSSAILISKDKGLSWEKVLELHLANRIALTKSYFNKSTIYAIASSNKDGGFFGFYISTDSGNNWKLQTNTPNILGYTFDGSSQGGQGQYDLCIESSIFDSNTVFIGGINIWKSENSGIDWNCISHWAGQDSLPYVHADHHFLKFSKNGVLFSCNDGGIYKSSDSGNTWNDISNGLSINQIYKFDVHRINNKKVISGTQDNGTLISNDINWQHVFGGDGMSCKYYTDEEKYVLMSLNNGSIYKSVNYGLNPKIVLNENITKEKSSWISEIAFNPQNEKSSYVGYYNIWKSEFYSDSGTFSKFTTFGDENPISNILINPNDTNEIFISKNNILLKYFADNHIWDTLFIFNNKITDIAIDSSINQYLYVSISGFNKNEKIYIINNLKANDSYPIKNISYNIPNIPINSIVCDKSKDNVIIYIGTDIGVFWLNPISNIWEKYGKDIPNVITNQLQIHKLSKKLFAGTFGRGLWKCDLIEFNNSFSDILTDTITICENDSFYIKINSRYDIHWNDGYIGNNRYLNEEKKYVAYYYDNFGNIEIKNIYQNKVIKAPIKPILIKDNNKLIIVNYSDYNQSDNIFWYFNDSLIKKNDFQINLLYNAQSSDLLTGEYYIIVENKELCKTISDTIFAFSGIDETQNIFIDTYVINYKQNLKLYLNSNVSIKTSNLIKLYNSLGKEIICNFSIYDNELNVITEFLPVGVYYLQINSRKFCKLLIL